MSGVYTAVESGGEFSISHSKLSNLTNKAKSELAANLRNYSLEELHAVLNDRDVMRQITGGHLNRDMIRLIERGVKKELKRRKA